MKLWEKVKAFFSGMLKVFKEFIEEALGMAEKIIIAQLKEYAVSVVKILAEKDLTNEQKRDEAFRLIKLASIKKKIDIKDSLINLIIELALQALKKKVENG